MSDAADKVTDPRLKALAAASAALDTANAVTATQAAAASGDASGGVSVSITYQRSHSRSDSLQTGNHAVASLVGAGRNLSIRAEGAGAESGVTVIGSQLSAANDASLKAEGQVDLKAAQSATTQKESNSSNSAGAGVALSYDAVKGGFGVGYTAKDELWWYIYGDPVKHPLEMGSYFGRWCIEAVAAVKAFGLDDSLCLGLEHYPGDLLRPDGPSTHTRPPERATGLGAWLLRVLIRRREAYQPKE